MMFGAIELLITSPVDRDFLCCELMLGSQSVAEVRMEPSGLVTQIFPKPGGGVWDLSHDELMAAFNEAKAILSKVDTSVII